MVIVPNQKLSQAILINYHRPSNGGDDDRDDHGCPRHHDTNTRWRRCLTEELARASWRGGGAGKGPNQSCGWWNVNDAGQVWNCIAARWPTFEAQSLSRARAPQAAPGATTAGNGYDWEFPRESSRQQGPAGGKRTHIKKQRTQMRGPNQRGNPPENPRNDSLTEVESPGYAAAAPSAFVPRTLPRPEAARMKKLRTASPRLSALALGATLLFTPTLSGDISARAATFHGTVKLPRRGASHAPLPGLLAAGERQRSCADSGAERPGTVVVLENISGVHPPPPKTVTVEIAGLDAQPAWSWWAPARWSSSRTRARSPTTVDAGRPDADAARAPDPRDRHQKFGAPGGLPGSLLRYPHLAVSVIVVDSPYFAAGGREGELSIAGVPDGKANLKVWRAAAGPRSRRSTSSGKEELTVKVADKAKKKDEAKETDPREAAE